MLFYEYTLELEENIQLFKFKAVWASLNEQILGKGHFFMFVDWGCVENISWWLNVWCDDQYNGGGPTNAEVGPRVYCQAVWDLWEAIYAGKSTPISLLQLAQNSVNDFSKYWLKGKFTTSLSKICILIRRFIWDKTFNYLHISFLIFPSFKRATHTIMLKIFDQSSCPLVCL